MSKTMSIEASQVELPVNPTMGLIREDRMPHIWCPGCGVGTTLNCFVRGLTQAKVNLKKTAIVSGIGCSGRVAGYVNLDSFHTTHGRAVPFATGLKLGNPELNVVVYSGDGDLFAIGGNHFIHAARRNVDLLVVCVNNFNYAMTGGQVASTTPLGAVASTAPYGNTEPPFNTCFLADCCGAVFVSRWTTYHVAQLTKTFEKALGKRGFRYIEIISPCPSLYYRRNKIGNSLDAMRYYRERCKIQHGADTRTIDMEFQGQVLVGNFVDREGPPIIPSITDQGVAPIPMSPYSQPECEEI